MEKAFQANKEMTDLLKQNLQKAAEAAGRLEKEDPIKVAYLAGRIDGLADLAWISGRSA